MGLCDKAGERDELVALSVIHSVDGRHEMPSTNDKNVTALMTQKHVRKVEKTFFFFSLNFSVRSRDPIGLFRRVVLAYANEHVYTHMYTLIRTHA